MNVTFIAAFTVLSCLWCSSARAQLSDSFLSAAALAKLNTSANRLSPVLRAFTKEKVVFDQRNCYILASFAYTKSTLSEPGLSGELQRSSQYAFPILYGRRLGSGIALEAGVYGGLLRSRGVGESIFAAEETLPACRNALTSGLILGLSYAVDERVNLKLRMRTGDDSLDDGWGNAQLGWSVVF